MSIDFLQILATVHFLALVGLALYGLHRAWFLWLWWQDRGIPDPSLPNLSEGDYPSVTIQLPIFNERFVAARLIDAAAKLEWPSEKLEIQVLDDSTDDTRSIIDKRTAFWKAKGICVHVLRRPHRKGYKAGALADGLSQASGALIAIFDADFVPAADFLKCTVPHFADKKIGMVQTRWAFLNSEKSWMTRIQTILLAPHFGIEHRVRCRQGFFFNFNGTAGIWRRAAIDSAGGWQADTVTEDLDLSYRAQLKNWRFLYLNDYEVPSELPVTLADFRSQQKRWAKGSTQTAKKILPRLLLSPQPNAIKAEAMAHLLANFGWLLGTIVTITLYPTILWRTGIGPYQIFRLDLPLFMCVSVAIMSYFALYAATQKDRRLIFWIPLLPVLTIGIAPSLAFAVIQGLFESGGVFERTPKFGLQGRQALPVFSALYHNTTAHYLLLNLALMAYVMMPLFFSWQNRTWIAVPLLFIFPLGFFLMIFQELGDWYRTSGIELKRFLKS